MPLVQSLQAWFSDVLQNYLWCVLRFWASPRYSFCCCRCCYFFNKDLFTFIFKEGEIKGERKGVASPRAGLGTEPTTQSFALTEGWAGGGGGRRLGGGRGQGRPSFFLKILFGFSISYTILNLPLFCTYHYAS